MRDYIREDYDFNRHTLETGLKQVRNDIYLQASPCARIFFEIYIILALNDPNYNIYMSNNKPHGVGLRDYFFVWILLSASITASAEAVTISVFAPKP